MINQILEEVTSVRGVARFVDAAVKDSIEEIRSLRREIFQEPPQGNNHWENDTIQMIQEEVSAYKLIKLISSYIYIRYHVSLKILIHEDLRSQEYEEWLEDLKPVRG